MSRVILNPHRRFVHPSVHTGMAFFVLEFIRLLIDLLRYARGEYEFDESLDADAPDSFCSNSSDCSSARPPLDMPLSRKSWIDVEVSDDKTIPKVYIFLSTRTLGLTCAFPFQGKKWCETGRRSV
jgi:hypothetical protein